MKNFFQGQAQGDKRSESSQNPEEKQQRKHFSVQNAFQSGQSGFRCFRTSQSQNQINEKKINDYRNQNGKRNYLQN